MLDTLASCTKHSHEPCCLIISMLLSASEGAHSVMHLSVFHHHWCGDENTYACIMECVCVCVPYYTHTHTHTHTRVHSDLLSDLCRDVKEGGIRGKELNVSPFCQLGFRCLPFGLAMVQVSPLLMLISAKTQVQFCMFSYIVSDCRE